jgi:hypothetical protein
LDIGLVFAYFPSFLILCNITKFFYSAVMVMVVMGWVRIGVVGWARWWWCDGWVGRWVAWWCGAGFCFTLFLFFFFVETVL